MTSPKSHSLAAPGFPLVHIAPLAALAGLLFCILAALGVLSVTCVSSGCQAFQGVTLFRLSLWWYGAACFAVLLLLLALKKHSLARHLALLAVLADCFLLGWMALSVTCTNCLLGGGLFALTALCLFFGQFKINKTAATALLLWLFLLSPNLFGLAHEFSSPWVMAGPKDAVVRLYFSPSCAACYKAVSDMSRIQGGAAFVPVCKEEQDLGRIIAMTQALSHGKTLPEALLYSQAHTTIPDDLPLAEELRFRLRLFANSVLFKRFGTQSFPLMTMSGWYAGPQKPHTESGAKHSGQGSSPNDTK